MKLNYSGVYFLVSPLTGLVKIGKSRNIDKRIDSFSSSNQDELKLIRVAYVSERHIDKAERWFHSFFKNRRYRSEWFDISENEIDESIRLCTYKNANPTNFRIESKKKKKHIESDENMVISIFTGRKLYL